MASRFATVATEEIIPINFLWCILSQCNRVVYIKTTIHLRQCRWPSGSDSGSASGIM